MTMRPVSRLRARGSMPSHEPARTRVPVQAPRTAGQAGARRLSRYKRLVEEPDTNDRNDPAGTTCHHQSAWPVVKRSDPDTQNVQEPCRQYKSYAVADGIGGGR